MSSKFINENKVASGLSLTSASPADDRVYFDSIAALESYVSNNQENKGTILHDGIKIMVSSKPVVGGDSTWLSTDYTEYTWTEASTGLLDTPYQYSAYSGNMANKIYNFVPSSSSVVLSRFVTGGDTIINIEQRYLPLGVRRDKVANVTIFEEITAGEYNIVFPDHIKFESGTQNLIIYTSAYTSSMNIKIKIY